MSAPKEQTVYSIYCLKENEWFLWLETTNFSMAIFQQQGIEYALGIATKIVVW